MLSRLKTPSLALACALIAQPISAGVDFFGEAGIEYQYFFEGSSFAQQGDDAFSISVEPTWSFSSADDKNLFDVKLFYRKDANDDERSHGDIRELSWIHTAGDWEFRSGISKVFWGVAETQHLVDIVNQTDSVDRLDGEVKLGQPMISVSRRTDIGDFEAFVLPYFRERIFQGIEGRLRPNLVVDTDNAKFESSRQQSNVDFAGRWSNSVGVWDFGLSYFNGTGREPIFDISNDGSRLIPIYAQIEQFGIDAQATVDSWLYKLEAIDRKAAEAFSSQDFSAIVLGFEKSFFNLQNSGADIGIVYEFSDSTQENSDASDSEEAHFLGLRLALNDEQSTDVLLGCDASASVCLLEGSRRLGDDFKLSVRANRFSGLDESTGVTFLEQDDFIQLNLSYFF